MKKVCLFISAFLIPALSVADFTDTAPSAVPTVVPRKTKTPTASAGANDPASTTKPKPQSSGQKGGGIFGQDVTRHNPASPFKYSGNSADLKKQKGILILKGDVVLTQGDTTITSDYAELTFSPESNQPKKAIAKGRVKVNKKPSQNVPPIQAVGEEMEYFVAEEKAILKGSPKIWRGEELVEGKVMEVMMATGEIKVSGVRGVVSPKKNQQKTPAGN